MIIINTIVLCCLIVVLCYSCVQHVAKAQYSFYRQSPADSNLWSRHKNSENSQLQTRNIRRLLLPCVYTTHYHSSCSAKPITCNKQYKYRSYNGSCNNLNRPTWGMARTVCTRLLPAHYRDAVSLPRVSVNGSPLPSARKISTTFFHDINNEDKDISLMGMTWAQFITHDILIGIDTEKKPIDCCHPSIRDDENICLPITVPQNDPFYSKYNVTCLNMERNLGEIIPTCNPALQQYNFPSHMIDGSHIYGPNQKLVSMLREFQGGRLLSSTPDFGTEFMQLKKCEPNSNNMCYKSGDHRVNQNPSLTVIHTLFHREHNRIVGELLKMHPTWDDEKLFQEGRSIIAAILQHITYNDWLPIMLGQVYITVRGLFSGLTGQYTYYDTIPPVAINSFTSAALRVGHSGIPGIINMYKDYNECPVKGLVLSNSINKPGVIQEHKNFEAFLRGSMVQPMQVWEQYYTKEVTGKFLKNKHSYGTDVISIDLQRGRDHGLPPYVDFVELCTGRKPETFADLVALIPEMYVRQLRELYYDINDIDLFIGGNLERFVQGARLGPTFQCIIGEQFYRLKYGDRFWYEIRDQPHSFTEEQLEEIKKITLSRIICDNSNIKEVTSRIFYQASYNNAPIDCKNIPSINLTQWL